MQSDPSEANQLHQAAGQLGLSLSDVQMGQMLGHLALLSRWNRTYNLTAIRDPAEMFRQHLLDSLAVVPALQRWRSTIRTIVDVGSGAGFPGLTLAATMPGSRIVCVDSVGKKVGFIRQVIAEVGLNNATAEHSRVEDLPSLGADVITSRAFASLADFATLTRKHLSADGVWMAMKGKKPHSEISALETEAPDIEMFHVEQLSVPGLASERCLVWMRLRPTRGEAVRTAPR